MDPLGTIQTVLSIAQQIKTLYDTVQSNHKKCEQLCDRVAAITQILKYHQEKITAHFQTHSGEGVPLALTQLLQVLTSTRDFITKYGSKGKLAKVFYASDIKDEFIALNDRISNAVETMTLFLTSTIHASVQHMTDVQQKQLQPSQVDLEQAFGCDAAESMDSNPNYSLLLWVDNNKKQNEKMASQVTSYSANTSLVCITHTNELVSIIMQNRILQDSSVSTTSRCRVITNKSRPEGKNGEFVEIVQPTIATLRKYNLSKTPVLIFTSTAENVEKLKQFRSSDPYVLPTYNYKALVNFGRMATLWWVWDAVTGENLDLKNHQEEFGTVCEHVKSVAEAKTLLQSRPDLKTSNYFRILTNRYSSELVQWMRGQGINTPVCVYTSKANLESAATAFKNLARVIITADVNEAHKFADMTPLFGETELSLSNSSLNSSGSSTNSPAIPKKDTAFGLSANDNNNSTDNDILQFNKIGVLKIHSIFCQDLISSNIGTCDPYIVASVGNQTLTTELKPKTCNPNWNSLQLEFPNVQPSSKLLLTVVDNLVREAVGTIEISIKEVVQNLFETYPPLQWTEKQYDLVLPPNKEENRKPNISVKLGFSAYS